MKKISVVSIGLLAVFLAWLLTSCGTLGTPTATPIPTEAESLPLYPSAKNVRMDNKEAPQKVITIFETTDSSQAVLDFYRSTLLLRGWVVLTDLLELPPLDQTRAGAVGYFWADRTGSAPCKLALLINFWAPHEVHLNMERWPDLSKAPLYPGAEQVKSHEAELKSTDPEVGITTTEYITSYIIPTPASLAVEKYYRDQMPQYGWTSKDLSKDGADRTTGIAKGLYFSYHWGGPEMLLAAASAQVIITPKSDGQTEVEVHIRGNDETTPYWKKHWGASN